MSKYEVKISRTVIVEVDEEKFTEEFMEEFRKLFYPFTSIGDHAAFIGKSYMNYVVTSADDFLEGYGELSDFGVKFIGAIDEDEEAIKQ